MLSPRPATRMLRWLLSGLFLCLASSSLSAQVNPAEITNPQLKAAETTYFPQIMALYHAINGLKTPFPMRLSRYVGLDPNQQAGADSRGVEFVYFQDRLLLKISGNYNAAYGAELSTQNQRASRTFSDVVSPVLTLVAKQIPEDVACDGIGFEIAYHVRTTRQNLDYEGKEILVVVFRPADVFAFVRADSDAARQEILNRSQIYLDGKEFGLALNQQNPVAVEAIVRTPPPQAVPAPKATAAVAGSDIVSRKILPPRVQPSTEPNYSSAVTPARPAGEPSNRPAPATTSDAEQMQTQFQTQLDALAKLGQAKFHLVDYAPPSFVLYRDQIVLQMTLRNTLHFAPESSSIYKRAAQSFDLFLALQLKDLLDQVPADASFYAYDITVVNQLGTETRAPSEAIEFICPRGALRQFLDADITNQQLIDESLVLVNGVRIALNLQLVE